MTTPPAPGPYSVSLTSAAARELRKLARADAATAAAIRGAITLLAVDPRPPASKQLVGRPAWRVRVGDHRIIYTINDGQLLIAVIAVRHRREAYR